MAGRPRKPRSGPRRLSPAAQELVTAHTWIAYRMAWRFARRHARDVPADELIADALYGLTYAASMFRTCHNVPFGAYATMVVRHRLIQAVVRWRRGKRAGRLPTVLTAQGEEMPWEAADRPAPDVQDSTAAREMCARVRRALPARLYKVLRLYHGEGYTLAEIGDRMGLSRQRIRQMVVQARDRVREVFPDWVGN